MTPLIYSTTFSRPSVGPWRHFGTLWSHCNACQQTMCRCQFKFKFKIFESPGSYMVMHATPFPSMLGTAMICLQIWGPKSLILNQGYLHAGPLNPSYTNKAKLFHSDITVAKSNVDCPTEKPDPFRCLRSEFPKPNSKEINLTLEL